MKQQTAFGVPSVAPDKVTIRRRREKVSGYASEPGTGPEGETCGTCDYFRERHYAKVYFKCGKIVDSMDSGTHGPGTDIRKRSPACSFWKAVE